MDQGNAFEEIVGYLTVLRKDLDILANQIMQSDLELVKIVRSLEIKPLKENVILMLKAISEAESYFSKIGLRPLRTEGIKKFLQEKDVQLINEVLGLK